MHHAEQSAELSGVEWLVRVEVGKATSHHIAAKRLRTQVGVERGRERDWDAAQRAAGPVM